MNMIIPSFLQPGDQIAIVATAGKITSAELTPALTILKKWKLDVLLSSTLYNSSHQMAGTDEERKKGLQEMLDHRTVKAILCARGGYGTTRFIDQLDFSLFKKYPKWICGFSDITALHLHLYQLGFQSIHGTMPILFSKNSSEALESLKNTLLGKINPLVVSSNPLNKKGKKSGELVGGNLSLLVHVIGTKSDVNMDGKILFIEDLDEYLYHLDRMMVQLKRAGKLKNLAGLVVGGMTQMKDNPLPFGKTIYEIIADAVKEYSYPVAYGFPIGHISDNRSVIHGRISTLEVNDHQVKLS
jgi:muramoyltetrapeptide carboxypeptidase